MKKYLNYLILLLPLIILGACIEEYSLDALPPTEEDAAFTFEASAESDNIINFTANSEFFIMNWDLGNGSTGTGKTVTATYPLKGTYTVKLTIFNAGGNISSTRTVVIEETDPVLLDKPLYNFLTGGASAVDGKIWVLDSAVAGHFGVGPDPVQAGYFPEWYQAGANEKRGGGMYDDRYTFKLAGFGFDMRTNGDVYINASQRPNFPGAVDSGVGDLRAPFNGPAGLSWSIVEPENGFPELTISAGGFLGYFAGSRTYQILSINENVMFLRYIDQANAGLSWYMRLIRAGFDSKGGDGGGDPDPGPNDGIFTLQDLIGNGKKAWKLKPAAKAFGVGPSPGSDVFYPNGDDLSTVRACLFNDEFIFNEGGVFEYDAKGDFFGEFYMGVETEGCQPEANLVGKPGEAWKSGIHSFSFTEGNESTRSKITVTGTGAFLVLPKAFNGGEYTSGPPTVNKSVTYEVLNYVKEGETEELTITIDITNNGGVFWSFILIPAEN
ncbi:PKD domain-containing protein [Aquiflexum sp. LQ15W]|uniref:PKD domain-containing protein n=1 Tax=Cognataquiflexum nitidum TaxID=2922272 RepID=UPI001F132251|nr:PKD domain-containing protein [Cognataquiflexum nitidum]MCH6199944.1 PKD domain-containing protein [Cognataquiflexum nitidum]